MIFKGVAPEDCKSVSKLIGVKIFINEFVAYSELGKAIQFRENITELNLFEAYYNGTLQVPKNLYMIWNVLNIEYYTKAFNNLISILMNCLRKQRKDQF